MYVVVFLVNFKMDYKWTRSTRNVVLDVYIHFQFFYDSTQICVLITIIK